MLADLQHAVAAAEADERVVAILLTGAGRGFCAGADMARLQATSEGKTRSSVEWHSADAQPGDFDMMGDDYRLGHAYLMGYTQADRGGNQRSLRRTGVRHRDDVRHPVRV